MVLFGGRSGEHGISCATAGGVLGAIDRETFDVVAVGVTSEGQWVPVSDDPAPWQLRGSTLPQVQSSDAVVLPPLKAITERGEFSQVESSTVTSLGEVDVVFPLLHGPYGEDGTLQGALELVDARYVGSGVLASALGMDKHYMKLIIQGSGVAVAPWVTVFPGEWDSRRDAIKDQVDALGYPVFVKPTRAGSSLGVSRVTSREGLEDAMAEALRHDPKVLIEAGVVGREVECAVLQGRDGAAPRTSLPAEVIIGDDVEFYDFGTKYLGEGTVDVVCPAELTAEQTAAVQDVARRVFVAFGLEGLARCDVFVTETGVIVNEINTMPGFTPFSAYPMMWEKSGIAYADLVNELIDLALTRPVGLR
ncbi:D-alanine--D-alanine ligase [Micrococcales bacterium 31B]|nr:D-alanine--D-alanine ligase [Micrococcales bacterium 31B]